jgi:mannose-1-phosphate guanylyltransferase
LETDILPKLAGARQLFAYETNDFWRQIKTAGSSVEANELYLDYYRKESPEKLAKTGTEHDPEVMGNVYIDQEAKIHPTAVIGPNVSIGPKVVIEEGVRIRDSIILKGALIKAHACILHSVIGWDSKIGEWSRIEGCKYIGPPHPRLTINGIKNPGATILGDSVDIHDEIIIRNCVVLPHKSLVHNHFNDVLM